MGTEPSRCDIRDDGEGENDKDDPRHDHNEADEISGGSGGSEDNVVLASYDGEDVALYDNDDIDEGDTKESGAAPEKSLRSGVLDAASLRSGVLDIARRSR